MRQIDQIKLIDLQNKRHVRNVCILAHVDHGKTTLADFLVANNGIISQRMAGKLRYMDSRPDEQERGITMKSSSITLYYNSVHSKDDCLINLIDSPGHVDFSSEVSTAVRLCDGAIVLVDVVEGVCPQTRICLKQAYTEHLKPILVLNKIDRLIVEKKMSTLDAYIHISQVLEQVNAVMGNLFASDILSQEEKLNENDYISGLEEADDSNLYFTPETGNVIFCSALDGWGFTVRNFAAVYEKKLGISRDNLEKAMWGDFYYNSKTKTYLSGAQEKAKKPMFVQFILDNIWHVYETIVIRRDKDKLSAIAEKLGIKLTTRDLRHSDPRVQIQTLFSQWLPLSNVILETIYKHIPEPGNISSEKAERLMCSLNQNFDSFPRETQELKKEFMNSNPESNNVIIFVSKMFAINKSQLPENKSKPLSADEIQKRRELARQRHQDRMTQFEKESVTNSDAILSEHMSQLMTPNAEVEEEVDDDETDDVFIAFARVYSGTLRKGSKLYVLGPKHDPRNLNVDHPLSSPHISEVTIENIYLLMGRELESVDAVPAGNIVGIGDLQNNVLKTATLSTNIYCPSFTELTMMATPILRVAIEPKSTLDMPKLIKGLKLLNQADPCVQVLIQETGEHVLLTLGEVHLERCIGDLEERFAKIKLNVSKPIVPFRETIVPKSTVDMVNEVIFDNPDNEQAEDKTIIIVTANKKCQVKILALPLSREIVDLLEKSGDILKALSQVTKQKELPERTVKALQDLKISLTKMIAEENSNKFPIDFVDRIWSLGPRKYGPNILLNMTDFVHTDFWDISTVNRCKATNDDNRNDFESSFINGFQLATLAGPLCEEPLQGVCFLIEEWTIETVEENSNQPFGPFSGQIMSAIKEGCRKAFQKQPQRLVTPMYSCNVIVNAEVLGKLYAAIGRRNGKILSGDLTQGSGNFSVIAVIPVIESFNFAQEIRKQTSGLAYPQLVFSHWEVIDIDPFWVPSTEEEYLHFGEKADSANRAKLYMDSVRKRKGLAVEEKIVEHAEKQRTLSKNK